MLNLKLPTGETVAADDDAGEDDDVVYSAETQLGLNFPPVDEPGENRASAGGMGGWIIILYEVWEPHSSKRHSNTNLATRSNDQFTLECRSLL